MVDGLITLFVNEQKYTILNPDPNLMLVDYFREKLSLTGPKKPCGEGGCGGCTTVMEKPTNFKDDSCPKYLSFNACLRRVVQCNDMHFYTTEFFGKWKYNADENPSQKNFPNIDKNISEVIAFSNGSQCKYFLKL